MDDVELPELPELEREIRKDKLNTLVAITVTMLVTFTAICKIEDNNIVLMMQQAKSDEVDNWSWYQSLNVREDLNQARLSDIKDNLQDENRPEKRKQLQARLDEFTALVKKQTDKKDKAKSGAQLDKQHYDTLNEAHEQYDRSEASVSIAVSMLALTSLLQKRWMYCAALIPAAFGIFKGVMGLLS